MRENVRAFCQLAAEIFPLGGPLYEFGAYQVQGQEERANLRGFFPRRAYFGCDARPGPGVERIEDLEALALPDECASTVLCFETLEHVFRVHDACGEMFRVLKPGGVLMVSVPFHFRIHAYPDDYWRMTPSCLLQLLEPYGARLLATVGMPKLPHTLLALAVKSPVAVEFVPRAGQLADAYREWLCRQQVSLGLARRAKRLAVSLLRSKGERARVRSWYHAEFVIDWSAEQLTKRRALSVGSQELRVET